MGKEQNVIRRKEDVSFVKKAVTFYLNYSQNQHVVSIDVIHEGVLGLDIDFQKKTSLIEKIRFLLWNFVFRIRKKVL